MFQRVKQINMLERLEVRNYKSLRDVKVRFEQFNVLVGLNASGKSNIIDCLLLVSESLQVFGNISQILERRGGFKHVVFQGEEEFDVKVAFSVGKNKCEYYMKATEEMVEERWLKINGREFIKEQRYTGKYLREDYSEVAFSGAWRSLTVGHPRCAKEISECLDYLSKWHFYSFSTPEIRRTLPAKKSFALNRDGSNLAQVLLSLRTERPKIFAEIEEMLKLAIPGVEELLTPLTEDGKPFSDTYVAVREKGFEHPFDYYQLSDGTLRLLAHITALNLDAELVCFEEPENFVHPYLLRLLVEVLKKSGKQVILSTHSPYFLDFVEPEDLIIVEKKRGETKVRRIEDEEEKNRVRKLLEDGIPLGEVYYSGALSGEE